ncbi:MULTISPECIES: AAA family ATPase [unclassified Crossiella]|uniref:nSTAND1 domain-containing NTPase n=1 Tax=unclassified Crossiella TaxID=2620835 RepID=UPI001FFEE865|nr:MULTISPECIES: AAA family ATPase [unclassified Crossiella]MCK2239440.1 hypothetical protein [Crossiella sp. S99.2]MCK2252135.1 hypothetical protein [Crossiella sp. S99.1]
MLLGLGTNLVTSAPDNWWSPLQPVARYAWVWLPALILAIYLFEHLRRYLATRHRVWHDGSPYPGLESFTADRAAVFFGRDNETRDLLERLARSGGDPAHRFVPLVGPSGSGKSSLIQAGVLAGLGSRWTVFGPVEPGPDPFGALASALTETDRSRCARLLHDEATQLPQRPPTDLATRLAGTRCLLVIDQWEDLTRVPEAERTLFVSLIEAVLAAQPNLHVLVALRPDALGMFAANRLFAHPYPVGPLEPRLLRQVIVGPARAAGVEFEDGLVEQMVAEATVGDALPLLGHLLQRLSGAKVITVEAYDRAGRVGGAIARHADEVRLALSAVHPDAEIEATLLRFVSWEGREPTRRAVFTADLDATGFRIADEFRAARLLAESGDGKSFDLAHDALLRQWSWLHDLIIENEDRLRRLALLSSQARAWAVERQDDDLLRGQALVLATETSADGVVAEFIAASQAAQRLSADSRARQAASWARQHRDSDIELARAIAAAAVRESASPAAVLSLWGLLAEPTRAQFPVGHTKHILAMVWLPDDDHLLTIGADGHECVWNRAGDLVETAELPLTKPYLAELSPDGSKIVLGDYVGTTGVWSRADGRWIAPALSDEQLISFRWSNDSSRLFSWSEHSGAQVWTFQEEGPCMSRRLAAKHIYAVSWSPDDALVALGSKDTVTILETSSWTAVSTREVDPVVDLSWSPTGDQLAMLVSSQPPRQLASTLIILDLSTSAEKAVKSPGSTRVSWSPARSVIAVTGTGMLDVQLVDTTDLSVLSHQRSTDSPLCWSASGTVLAFVPRSTSVRIWDTETDTLAVSRGGELIVAASHPDHSRLVLSQRESDDIVLAGWTPTEWTRLPCPPGRWLKALWSEAAGLIAGENTDEVVVWSATTHQIVRRFPRGGGFLAWSPDGRHLATHQEERPANGPSAVTVWSMECQEPVASFPTAGRGYGPLDWSPDSDRLAISDGLRSIEVWLLSTQEHVATIEAADGISLLSWSPDGSRVAGVGTDLAIRCWDLATGTRHSASTSQQVTVEFLDWSPDGRRLLSCAHDLRIWDADTCDELAVLTPTGHVIAVDWYDDHTIRVINSDGTRLTWTPTEDAAALLAAADARELTAKERVRFGLTS